jgi:hypothetical protein
MNEWDVIFGCEEVKPTKKTMQGAEIPELLLDDLLWQYAKPKPSPVCAKVQSADFVNAIVGDCPTPEGSNLDAKALGEFTKLTSAYELSNSANDQRVDAMLKSGGKSGQKLKNMMRKSLTLSEAMGQMLFNFSEFFTEAEQTLLKKQILALDLPGFLEMFNAKVINAQV